MPLLAPDSAAIDLNVPARKSASDTLANALAETMKPGEAGATGWHLRVYTSLHEVECVLDRLENAGVEEREVITAGPHAFIVRWR